MSEFARARRVGALLFAVTAGVSFAGPYEAAAQEGHGDDHPHAAAHHGDPAEAEAAVAAVLDELHAAASSADFERYFALYAEDAVFLGTDATERWTLAEFQNYARAPFSQGRGWTYTMLERHITISEHGHVAWFDERLDNASLGETRGSGVLVHSPDGWKIAQYNLTIPIPNDLADEVVGRIREVEQEP